MKSPRSVKSSLPVAKPVVDAALTALLTKWTESRELPTEVAVITSIQDVAKKHGVGIEYTSGEFLPGDEVDFQFAIVGNGRKARLVFARYARRGTEGWFAGELAGEFRGTKFRGRNWCVPPTRGKKQDVTLCLGYTSRLFGGR